jgi:hypothetical protein
MRRLLEYDPHRGLRIDYVGHGDGTFSLEYMEDAEPLLETNKAKQSAGRDYYAKDPDMWRVASVPITIQYEWIRRYGVDPLQPGNEDLLRRLLNSNEWRYLKTAEVMI